MKKRIGVIGLGVISKYYIAALMTSETTELRAVCDTDRAKLEPFRHHERLLTTENYLDVLRDPEIDGVVITLPNHLHFSVVEQALRHGKSVCCEKPLTMSSDEAEKLCTMSQQLGKTLFTAFHRRYNSNLTDFLSGLDKDDPITAVEADYFEKIEEHAGNDSWYLDPARCGGGCIADNGPNVFDTLRFVIGDLHVTGASLSCDERGVDRYAVIDGVSASRISFLIRLDWSYPHGEKKDLLFTFQSGRRQRVDLLKGYQSFKSSLWHEYLEIVEDFVRAIESRLEIGTDGYRAVELVEQAYACATDNRAEARRCA